MAAYDQQEQEQLEDLKAWWALHGNKIASVIIVLAVAYLGYQGWRWYSTGHVEAASTLYAAVSEGARTNNPAKAKEAMAQLADRYAGTPYAPRAALLYAKTLWDSGDKATHSPASTPTCAAMRSPLPAARMTRARPMKSRWRRSIRARRTATTSK